MMALVELVLTDNALRAERWGPCAHGQPRNAEPVNRQNFPSATLAGLRTFPTPIGL